MGKSAIKSTREMLESVGSSGADDGYLIPLFPQNSGTLGGSSANENGHMVPNRKKPGRRAFLDGNFARRKLRLLPNEYRLEHTNPCRAVRWNKSRKCERFRTTAELARLGEVLTEARAGSHKVKRIAATAISLLLLTGCRHSEVLNLKWAELHGNRLKLTDSKTGPRTVWLGDEARALIDSLPRRKTISWLFWNSCAKCPLRNVSHYWNAIRDQAGLPGVRIHDLRHTFASHAAMNQETLPMIGRLLGHVNPRSTARYAHFDDDHVLDAAQQIGDVIERMMDGLPKGLALTEKYADCISV